MSERERLPNRRVGESFELEVAGLRYTATIGGADANAKDAAVICSLALQFGVPLDVIRRALLRDSHGRPSSPLGTALDRLAGDGA
jgi:hypothetical protein